ncbi:hypothetical protein SK128_007561 [Halocaridina rubra]|uniref:Uncharacterized protein n=1 Tax=Halocaridina rubra TaxID=373956 RepID=A0AAN8XBG2_HALRR
MLRMTNRGTDHIKNKTSISLRGTLYPTSRILRDKLLNLPFSKQIKVDRNNIWNIAAMIPRALIILTALLLPSETLAIDDLFEKYTFSKVMRGCFGNESYIHFLSQVNQANRYCSYLTEEEFFTLFGTGNSVTQFFESLRPRYFGSRPQLFNVNTNSNNNFLNVGNLFDSSRNAHRGGATGITRWPIRSARSEGTTESSFIIVADENSSGEVVRPLHLERRKQYSFNPDPLSTGSIVHWFSCPLVQLSTGSVVTGSVVLKPFSSLQIRFNFNSHTVGNDEVKTAVENVREALLHFTCVLRRMDIIDTNFNVNYRTVVNTFIETNILDYRLRQDLREGIAFCRDAMRCLPENVLPIPVELQLLLEFMKCEKRKRLISCFRQDLRQNLHLFDLSALPEDRGRGAYLENLMAVVMGVDILGDTEFN